MIEGLPDEFMEISAPDIGEFYQISCSDAMNTSDKGSLTLNIYQYFMENHNCGKAIPLKITAFCDAPRLWAWKFVNAGSCYNSMFC